MSIPTWDATLPQKLLVSGLSGEAGGDLLRSTMDVGPAKQRPRGTAGPEPITGTILCTAAQFTTFWTQYDDTLLVGSLRFNWTHPVTDAAVEMRFRSKPKWSAEGKLYRFTLELEVLP